MKVSQCNDQAAEERCYTLLTQLQNAIPQADQLQAFDLNRWQSQLFELLDTCEQEGADAALRNRLCGSPYACVQLLLMLCGEAGGREADCDTLSSLLGRIQSFSGGESAACKSADRVPEAKPKIVITALKVVTETQHHGLLEIKLDSGATFFVHLDAARKETTLTEGKHLLGKGDKLSITRINRLLAECVNRSYTHARRADVMHELAFAFLLWKALCHGSVILSPMYTLVTSMINRVTMVDRQHDFSFLMRSTFCAEVLNTLDGSQFTVTEFANTITHFLAYASLASQTTAFLPPTCLLSGMVCANEYMRLWEFEMVHGLRLRLTLSDASIVLAHVDCTAGSLAIYHDHDCSVRWTWREIFHCIFFLAVQIREDDQFKDLMRPLLLLLVLSLAQASRVFGAQLDKNVLCCIAPEICLSLDCELAWLMDLVVNPQTDLDCRAILQAHVASEQRKGSSFRFGPTLVERMDPRQARAFALADRLACAETQERVLITELIDDTDHESFGHLIQRTGKPHCVALFDDDAYKLHELDGEGSGDELALSVLLQVFCEVVNSLDSLNTASSTADSLLYLHILMLGMGAGHAAVFTRSLLPFVRQLQLPSEFATEPSLAVIRAILECSMLCILSQVQTLNYASEVERMKAIIRGVLQGEASLWMMLQQGGIQIQVTELHPGLYSVLFEHYYTNRCLRQLTAQLSPLHCDLFEGLHENRLCRVDQVMLTVATLMNRLENSQARIVTDYQLSGMLGFLLMALRFVADQFERAQAADPIFCDDVVERLKRFMNDRQHVHLRHMVLCFVQMTGKKFAPGTIHQFQKLCSSGHFASRHALLRIESDNLDTVAELEPYEGKVVVQSNEWPLLSQMRLPMPEHYAVGHSVLIRRKGRVSLFTAYERDRKHSDRNKWSYALSRNLRNAFLSAEEIRETMLQRTTHCMRDVNLSTQVANLKAFFIFWLALIAQSKDQYATVMSAINKSISHGELAKFTRLSLLNAMMMMEMRMTGRARQSQLVQQFCNTLDLWMSDDRSHSLMLETASMLDDQVGFVHVSPALLEIRCDPALQLSAGELRLADSTPVDFLVLYSLLEHLVDLLTARDDERVDKEANCLINLLTFFLVVLTTLKRRLDAIQHNLPFIAHALNQVKEAFTEGRFANLYAIGKIIARELDRSFTLLVRGDPMTLISELMSFTRTLLEAEGLYVVQGDSLLEQMRSREREPAKLHDELEVAMAAYDEEIGRIQQVLQQVSEISRLRAREVEELDARVLETQRKRDASLAALQAHIDSHKERTELLNRKVAQLQTSKCESEQETSRQLAQLDALEVEQAAVAAQAAEIVQRKEEYRKLTGEVDDLNALLTHKQLQVMELQRRIRTWSAQIVKLQDAREKVSAQACAKKKEELHALEAKLTAEKTELKELRETQECLKRSRVTLLEKDQSLREKRVELRQSEQDYMARSSAMFDAARQISEEGKELVKSIKEVHELVQEARAHMNSAMAEALSHETDLVSSAEKVSAQPAAQPSVEALPVPYLFFRLSPENQWISKRVRGTAITARKVHGMAVFSIFMNLNELRSIHTVKVSTTTIRMVDTSESQELTALEIQNFIFCYLSSMVTASGFEDSEKVDMLVLFLSMISLKSAKDSADNVKAVEMMLREAVAAGHLTQPGFDAVVEHGGSAASVEKGRQWAAQLSAGTVYQSVPDARERQGPLRFTWIIPMEHIQVPLVVDAKQNLAFVQGHSLDRAGTFYFLHLLRQAVERCHFERNTGEFPRLVCCLLFLLRAATADPRAFPNERCAALNRQIRMLKQFLEAFAVNWADVEPVFAGVDVGKLKIVAEQLELQLVSAQKQVKLPDVTFVNEGTLHANRIVTPMPCEEGVHVNLSQDVNRWRALRIRFAADTKMISVAEVMKHGCVQLNLVQLCTLLNGCVEKLQNWQHLHQPSLQGELLLFVLLHWAVDAHSTEDMILKLKLQSVKLKFNIILDACFAQHYRTEAGARAKALTVRALHAEPGDSSLLTTFYRLQDHYHDCLAAKVGLAINYWPIAWSAPPTTVTDLSALPTAVFSQKPAAIANGFIVQVNGAKKHFVFEAQGDGIRFKAFTFDRRRELTAEQLEMELVLAVTRLRYNCGFLVNEQMSAECLLIMACALGEIRSQDCVHILLTSTLSALVSGSSCTPTRTLVALFERMKMALSKPSTNPQYLEEVITYVKVHVCALNAITATPVEEGLRTEQRLTVVEHDKPSSGGNTLELFVMNSLWCTVIRLSHRSLEFYEIKRDDRDGTISLVRLAPDNLPDLTIIISQIKLTTSSVAAILKVNLALTLIGAPSAKTNLMELRRRMLSENCHILADTIEKMELYQFEGTNFRAIYRAATANLNLA